MALTKIKGQNFRAFVGGSAVTEATNCSITISGSMEDASHKDIEGTWTQEQLTSSSWQVQVDSLQATVDSLRALVTQFNSDRAASVGFDATDGPQNRNAKNAPFARAGLAHLTDLSITAKNRTNVTVSSQYQGTGPLS